MIAPGQIHAPADGIARSEQHLRDETPSPEAEALRVVICLWPLKRRVSEFCRPQRLVRIRTAASEPAFVALVGAASWYDLRSALPPALIGLVLAEGLPHIAVRRAS